MVIKDYDLTLDDPSLPIDKRTIKLYALIEVLSCPEQGIIDVFLSMDKAQTAKAVLESI